MSTEIVMGYLAIVILLGAGLVVLAGMAIGNLAKRSRKAMKALIIFTYWFSIAVAGGSLAMLCNLIDLYEKNNVPCITYGIGALFGGVGVLIGIFGAKKLTSQ